ARADLVWQHWLLNRNRIGRRKGVLKSFVKRFFVAPALALVAILIMRLLFPFGNHSISPTPAPNCTVLPPTNCVEDRVFACATRADLMRAEDGDLPDVRFGPIADIAKAVTLVPLTWQWSQPS